MIELRRVAESPGEHGWREGSKIGKGTPFRVKWAGCHKETSRRRIRKVHERVTDSRWGKCNWVEGCMKGEEGGGRWSPLRTECCWCLSSEWTYGSPRGRGAGVLAMMQGTRGCWKGSSEHRWYQKALSAQQLREGVGEELGVGRLWEMGRELRNTAVRNKLANQRHLVFF